MEALLSHEALKPPSTSPMSKEEEESGPTQTQTAGQVDAEEELLIPMPTSKPPPPVNLPAAVKPDPPMSPSAQAEGDLLDEVADMNIPKTINMESFEDDNRANQVISPDGSTYDGTSTIGSATSEPTNETGVSRGTRSTRKGTTASGRSINSRGGNSRGGNSRGGNSRSSQRGSGSRTGTSRKGASPQTNSQTTTPRRSYRNTYSSGDRMVDC